MQGGKRSNREIAGGGGMSEGHPDAATLERYVRGELGREPRRALEGHLASCPLCQSAVDALPLPPGPVRWQGHRFAARRLAREREEEVQENLDGVLRALGPIIAAVSRGELAELLDADELRRRALIRQEPRFRSLALCALLEARCRAVWLDEPEAAVELAKLAVLIAERLAADGAAGPVAETRAMALMHLGNACRIAAEERRRRPSEIAEGAATGARFLIGEATGSSWEAEAALWELRDAFLERGMPLDAALVCLDLGAAFLRGGRERELRDMLTESLPLFAEHGADPFVLDALRYLQSESGPPSLDRLDKVARLLQDARHDPRREEAVS
jgi:hypothetical protein